MKIDVYAGMNYRIIDAIKHQNPYNKFNEAFSHEMAIRFGIDTKTIKGSLISDDDLNSAEVLFTPADYAASIGKKFGLTDISNSPALIANRGMTSNMATIELAKFVQTSDEWMFFEGFAIRDSVTNPGTCVAMKPSFLADAAGVKFVAATVLLSKEDFINFPNSDKGAYFSLNSALGTIDDCVFEMRKQEVNGPKPYSGVR